MGTEYLIGLDLGREVDHSAWAAIETREFTWHSQRGFVLNPGDYYDKYINYNKTKAEIGLIGLSQIPLHTPWETVARELDGVIARCNERTKGADVEVWVDATGIGLPVLEAFIEPVVYESHSNAAMRAVKITAGEQDYDTSTETVSKVHLIDTAMVLREKGELVIAGELQNTPIMDLFEKQIQDFRRKAGKRAGTIRYEAREGEHDDLVIAFALACLGTSRPGAFRVLW